LPLRERDAEEGIVASNIIEVGLQDSTDRNSPIAREDDVETQSLTAGQ